MHRTNGRTLNSIGIVRCQLLSTNTLGSSFDEGSRGRERLLNLDKVPGLGDTPVDLVLSLLGMIPPNSRPHRLQDISSLSS